MTSTSVAPAPDHRERVGTRAEHADGETQTRARPTIVLVRRLSILLPACGLIAGAILLASARHPGAAHGSPALAPAALALRTMRPTLAPGLPRSAPRNCSIASGGCVTGCPFPVAGRPVVQPEDDPGCAGLESLRPCMLPVVSAQRRAPAPFCRPPALGGRVEHNPRQRAP